MRQYARTFYGRPRQSLSNHSPPTNRVHSSVLDVSQHTPPGQSFHGLVCGEYDIPSWNRIRRSHLASRKELALGSGYNKKGSLLRMVSLWSLLCHRTMSRPKPRARCHSLPSHLLSPLFSYLLLTHLPIPI